MFSVPVVCLNSCSRHLHGGTPFRRAYVITMEDIVGGTVSTSENEIGRYIGEDLVL
jgi:hypothetical protein